MNETLLRLHNILNFPLAHRCDEVRLFIRDCGIKDLQAIYPLLLDHIFGTGNRTGWNLCVVTSTSNPREYTALLSLLCTKGGIFELVYRLMSDCYLKYEFPFTLIPLSVRKAFEVDVPGYYLDKVQIDQQTRMLTSLALNPFEFFMFHFSLHLVNPWVARTASQLGDTAYEALVEDYLTCFLPCDGSPVCPPVDYYIVKSPLPRPQAVTTPAKTPTLFRPSLFNKQPPSTMHPAPIAAPTPHMEVWRTETVLQAISDLWLTYSSSDTSSVTGARELPSVERMRVIRIVVKHLHYFANTAAQDTSPMGEVKSSVRPLVRNKIYKFLRNTICDWPLDGSFRIVLEAWLSYIQPWRYMMYSMDGRVAPLPEDAPRVVDPVWIDFIIDNLFAYTVIFQQLIPRFARLDLTTTRNAYMLHRLSKVFSLQNLNVMIAEGEACMGGPIPIGLQGRQGLRSLHQNAGKWGVMLRQQLQELEGPHFQYTFLFDDSSGKVSELLHLVLEATVAARILHYREEKALERAPPTFRSWLRDMFMGVPELNMRSVEELKKVAFYLELSLEELSGFFMLPTPPIPEGHPVDLQDMKDLPGRDSTFYEHVNDKVLSPEGKLSRMECLRYEGDPDLEPVKSSEVTVLVWLFYHVSCKFNQMYGEEMRRQYFREDFMGRIIRQILSPPMVIRKFDKRSGKRFAPLVEEVLPPRLSLRPLADGQRTVRILVYSLILWVWGFKASSIVLILFFFFVLYVVGRALLEPVISSYFTHESPAPPLNVSDVSRESLHSDLRL